MIKCTKCNASVPDGEVVCPNCGEKLQLVPDYESLDMGIIANDKKNEDDKLKEIEEARDERLRVKQKNKKRNLIIGIIIAAAAAVVIIVAVTALMGAIPANSTFSSAYKSALQDYNAGKYESALELVNRALSYEEKNAEGLLLKAKIDVELDNKTEALSIVNQLIEMDDENEDAYQLGCDICVSQDDYTELYSLFVNAPSSIKKSFSKYIVPEPTVTPDEGVYKENQKIKIKAKKGTIYYTTDGTNPTSESTKYDGAIQLTVGETTLKAVAITDDGIQSPIVEKVFEIDYDALDAPEITPESGEYSGTDNKITINVPEGTTAYYAFDRRVTTDGTQYTGPIEMPEGTHLFYAMVVNEKGVKSMIAARTFKYSSGTAASNTDNSNSTNNSNSSNNTNNSNSSNYSYNSNDGYYQPSYNNYSYDDYYDSGYNNDSGNYNYYDSGNDSGSDSDSGNTGGSEVTPEPTTEPTPEPTPDTGTDTGTDDDVVTEETSE